MRTTLRVTFVVAIALLLNGTAPVAGDSSPRKKLDAMLQQALDRDGDDAVRQVIVRLEPEAAGELSSVLKKRGDKLRRVHPGISAFTVDAKHLMKLAEHPAVKSISVDARIEAHQLPVFTPLPDQDIVRRAVSLPGAWTGAGIGVAIIDSGIEMSAEFQGRVSAFYDFTQGGAAVAPYDDYGHGTHVAGLIGGSGALSNGAYAGLAPGARFVGLKVLDRNGSGQTSNVISAIEFVTANRAALGVDIINLSLGHAPFESAATDPLVRAVEAATRAGIVVVVSAGNHGRNATTGVIGYTGITSPGTAPSALTVGSLMTQNTIRRSDDRVNNFSSRGPTYYDAIAKPDVIAPGYRLIAAAAKAGSLYVNYPDLRVAGLAGLVAADYQTLSGTSMAAAVATGVVAQLLQANRSTNPTVRLPVNAVKAILQYTAVQLRDNNGVPYDRLTQGAGALNGAGAAGFARGVVNSRSVGTNWLDSAYAPDTGATTIDGETVVWGDTVVWGNRLLNQAIQFNQNAWASTVVWGDTVVWGNTVVWGDNIVWDQTVVWGNTVVWGDSILQGNTVVWGNNDLTAIANANSYSLFGNTLINPQP